MKEMNELNNSFSNLSESHTKGITLKDTHYKIIRADKYSIYAKKVYSSLKLHRIMLNLGLPKLFLKILSFQLKQRNYTCILTF